MFGQAAETIIVKFYGAAFDAFLSFQGSTVGFTDVSFLKKILTNSLPGVKVILSCLPEIHFSYENPSLPFSMA